MKTLGFIMALIYCTQVYSQSDSTLNVIVLTRYSNDRASASGEPFTVFTAEAIFNKSSITIVPSYRSKTFYSIQAKQAGVTAYKSFQSSYINVGLFYSSDNLFPTWNMNTDYYLNVVRGLELRIGYNYRTYTDGATSHMGILGFAYEHKRIRANYNVYKPFDNRLAHQVSLRRLLNTPLDYLQLSYTYGRDDSMANIDRSANLISSYRMSINKRILSGLQLTLTASLSDIRNEDLKSLDLGYEVGVRIDLQ